MRGDRDERRNEEALVKLGMHIGYWGAMPPTWAPEAIAEAERLGFDSIWTAESWGSDAMTPLAWWGSASTRLRLGTNLAQLSARTPTATAMAALTMDHLSNGRFVLGLGASGPQVVEGWYGQPYPKPLARTREYVSIIRQIVAREKPVEFEGEQYQLPFRGGTGLGKPLKSTVHPLRTDIPIYIGAEGPKNSGSQPSPISVRKRRSPMNSTVGGPPPSPPCSSPAPRPCCERWRNSSSSRADARSAHP